MCSIDETCVRLCCLPPIDVIFRQISYIRFVKHSSQCSSQFLFISRSVISMVIGVDIMALVKTHLYSFYSMQTNATDPKTLIEL